jgi:hypothetical protein
MPQNEKPRSKPEVIPPNDTRPHRGLDDPRMQIIIDTPAMERVYIAKPGLLGMLFIVLITGILSAVLLVLLSAAFLVAAPLIVLLITAAVVVSLVRSYFGGLV